MSFVNDACSPRALADRSESRAPTTPNEHTRLAKFRRRRDRSRTCPPTIARLARRPADRPPPMRPPTRPPAHTAACRPAHPPPCRRPFREPASPPAPCLSGSSFVRLAEAGWHLVTRSAFLRGMSCAVLFFRHRCLAGARSATKPAMRRRVANVTLALPLPSPTSSTSVRKLRRSVLPPQRPFPQEYGTRPPPQRRARCAFRADFPLPPPQRVPRCLCGCNRRAGMGE